MDVTPYLHFDGNCEEAINFYVSALGGAIESLNRYAGSPLETMAGEMYKDKIMHATVVAGGVKLMASDAVPGHERGSGIAKVTLSLNSADAAEAVKVFEALAAGGEVTMPLQEVFWG
jgi:PhnB protein